MTAARRRSAGANRQSAGLVRCRSWTTVWF